MLSNGKICFSIFLPLNEGSGSGVLTDSNAMSCKKKGSYLEKVLKCLRAQTLAQACLDSIT